MVVESPDFAAGAKAAGLGDDEMRRIIDHVARRPDAGDLIPGPAGRGRYDSPRGAKGRAVVIG